MGASRQSTASSNVRRPSLGVTPLASPPNHNNNNNNNNRTHVTPPRPRNLDPTKFQPNDNCLLDNDKNDTSFSKAQHQQQEPANACTTTTQASSVIIRKEGYLSLGNNQFNKRYFCLFDNGILHVTKNHEEHVAGKIGTRLVVQRIEAKHAKSLRGVTFVFQNGNSKNYKTDSHDGQQEWIQAGLKLNEST